MRLVQKTRCRILRLLSGIPNRSSTLYVLGDSLSAGCYPSFLSRQLRQTGLAVGVRVFAKPGATSAELLRFLKTRLRSKTTDDASRQRDQSVLGALLLVGTNNLKHGKDCSRETFRKDITSILTFLRGHAPNAFLTVGTIPLPGRHARLREDSSEIIKGDMNPCIRQTAEELGDQVCELEGIFHNAEHLRSDGVHPTLVGERRLAEHWAECIIPLLSDVMNDLTSPESRASSAGDVAER